MNKKVSNPVKGQTIYIPSRIYCYRGEDDMVGVKENPNTLFNWNSLMEQQKDLKERFGDNYAYADPDYRSEFNNPHEGWTRKQ